MHFKNNLLARLKILHGDSSSTRFEMMYLFKQINLFKLVSKDLFAIRKNGRLRHKTTNINIFVATKVGKDHERQMGEVSSLAGSLCGGVL